MRIDAVVQVAVPLMMGIVLSGCRMGGDSNLRSDEVYTFPAEFGPHEAVWMVWKGEPDHDAISVRAIAAMIPFVRIELVVEEERLVGPARQALSVAGVDLQRVRTHVQSPTDFYYRDAGPLFLVGSRSGLKVADFSWNGYGSPPETLDERIRGEGMIARDIARRLGLATVVSDAVTEGGAIDVNGHGTMLAVETLALQRNPGWSLQQIEREYLRVLGQKKLIWLKEGLVNDPLSLGKIADDYFSFGTGGHIDQFARFASPDTILLASVTPEEREENPVSRMNYDRLEESYRRLRAASDEDGRPFTIIRVPLPGVPYETHVVEVNEAQYFAPFGVRVGERIRWLAPASYLNYFATNGVVLIPSFWRPGHPPLVRERDDEARRLFERLFPGRTIVQIDTWVLNLEGGGLHCIVQQQPATTDSASRPTTNGEKVL